MKPSSIRPMAVTTRLSGVGGIIMRVAVVAAILGLSVLNLSAITNAQAAVRQSTNIAAQGLGPALQALAKARNFQLVYRSELVKDLHTQGASGELTSDEALTQLLSGTGLTFRYLDDRTVTVFPASSTHISSEPLMPAMGDGAQDPDQRVSDSGSRKSFWNRIRLAQADQSAVRTDTSSVSEEPETDQSGVNRIDDQVDLGEIVVTGTNIRGVYPASSPVDIYTAEDIARTGATTTEQFIQKLPQNLGTRSQFDAATIGTGAKLNLDSTAGVDLRGLGIGTSLVLLNGRHLSRSDFGRTADVSLIPLTAVARVEILTDGASAIYGSDAVGGVVNFVLRDDFSGALTSLSYGVTGSGGMDQGNLSHTAGRNWSSGHGLLSYNYFSASPLDVLDRDYSAAAERGTLTPDEERHNLLATLSQQLSARLAVNADLAFARREVESASPGVTSSNPLSHNVTAYATKTRQSFANLAFDYDVGHGMNASITTSYSKAEVDNGYVSLRYKQTPPTFSALNWMTEHSLLDLTAMLDGELFALPGGAARFSLGAGTLSEKLSGASTTLGTIDGELGRRTAYAFGELFLPLIGASRNIPLVHRLELNLAVRHTRYDDTSTPALNQEFGSDADPKIGLLWAPSKSLNLRATYGTSFRAPALVQLDETAAANFLIGTGRIPLPSGPLATRIQVAQYAVPDLAPETAETYTVGFDFRPAARRSLQLRGTYYDISYRDRIAQAPTGGAAFLQTPELYPDVIYHAPSVEFIEQILRTTDNRLNTSGVSLTDLHLAAQNLFAMPNVWIADLRLKNLALSEQDGFDLSVSDVFDTTWGQLRAGGNVTRILSYKQQASSNSIVVSVIDQVTQPVNLRGRAYLGVSHGAVDATFGVNYVDNYTNPFATTGSRTVASWTTTDLSLSYDLGANRRGFFEGLNLNLSIQNLFDRDPPFIERDPSLQAVTQPIGFDPTNANPLGRLIVVGASKSW